MKRGGAFSPALRITKAEYVKKFLGKLRAWQYLPLVLPCVAISTEKEESSQGEMSSVADGELG